MVISVSRGGDDDALFLGTVIPITGFLIGLFRYRMEFFEGFVINIGFCVPFAFFFALAGYIGAPVCEHRPQSAHEPSSGRNWN